MFKITSGFYIVIWTQIVNICIIYKEILYMGIYIVKKTFFYGNEVGGALRGTRQGTVLKYLISTTGLLFISLRKNVPCEMLPQKTHGSNCY